MFARVRPPFDPRLFAFFAVAVAALIAATSAWGCAALLGFEDTTLRSDTDADLVEGGTFEGGPLEEGGPRPDGGASRLTALPASLIVRRGGSVDVSVNLERASDVAGVVTIRVSALPAGVTATTATLAPGITTGSLKISATATAALGPQTITLNADGTTLPATLVPLLVADGAGALDTTYDADGLLSDAAKGTGSTFFALALQPDSMVVAAGAGGASAGALNGWIVRRFTTNGAVDGTFSKAAAVLPADGEARAVVIDAKGNIIVAGVSQPAPLQQLTIVRLLPTGALDTTFAGGTVRVAAEVGATASFAYGVAVQTDGAVVVVGARRDIVAGSTDSGIIIRFNENGTRDATFNGGATVVLPNARFVGVSVDTAGVLAAGSTIGGALPSYVVTRRTAAGAVDTAFGSGGTAAFGNTYRANGFAHLPDGSIALVGEVQQGAAGYTAGVATAKGTPVFARAYALAANAGFFGVGVQADGRVIAAGHTAVTNGEARVERILADGSKDTTFGGAGTATIESAGVPNGFDVTLYAATVQKDGRILVGGNRSNSGASIYRLWP